jgi:hypothetical protein
VIYNKLKPCCNDCKHRKTYLKEERSWSDNGVHDVLTKIGCYHEVVCIEYIASEVVEEINSDEKADKNIEETASCCSKTNHRSLCFNLSLGGYL